MMWQRFLKSVIDFLLATLGLLFLSPFLFVVALLIKLDSSGPIFFVQERVGLNGKVFNFIKFRTMVEGARNMGLGLEIAQGDERITRVGHWLRHWSLDEIPQLINVVRGDMSLIGPRPSTPDQVARYTPDQRRRLEVRPGLTGWAQVNGRNLIPWPERIELDIWYIDHWSLLLDANILLKTIPVIVWRKGLYGEDGVVRDLSQ
jgi:lipopolysaccharide/colanic/teichoic acid biosynthesis glycosyltransferase